MPASKLAKPTISALGEPKPCYVYLLLSRAPTLRSYVGWTHDLDARLARHNDGRGAKATRGRQWELVHSERFKTRSDAMSREYELKKDRRQRSALVDGYLKGHV